MIVEAIISIFYKMTRNTRLVFNLTITDFFEPFCTRMLAFLFAIIYCSIREYQSEIKVIKLFKRKIAQSIYCYIAIHSHGYANIDDRYVYTDPPAVV